MKILFLIQLLLLLGLVSCGSDNNAASGFTLKGSSSSSASLVGTQFLTTVYPGAPTTLNMKIYQIWVSANADCSSPVSVCTHSGAEAQMDLVSGPTLCTGSPAAGTYPCMILKMSDTFKFKPDATAAASVPGGICTAGADTYMDIYRGDDADANTWKDMSNVVIPSTGTVATSGAVEDTVYIFATTNPAAVAGTTVPHQVVTLTAAMTVPGQATFYTDFSNQFSVNGANCWIEAPTMGFR